MRYLIAAITVLAWFGVMTPASEACSCAGAGSPCESYGSASAVFSGTVVATREKERSNTNDPDDIGYRRIFKFSVEQSFLGVDTTEIEILTGSGGGDCGYAFKIGGRYLVYAYRYRNELVTTICSRTKPFAQATEDLAFLSNLSSAAPGVTIHGQLVRGRGAKTEMAAMAANALIKIEGGNVRKEVRLDADGRYRISGLPAGKFKVALQLPETLVTDRPEREISVADRGCAAVTYYVNDNGRVMGRLLDAEGQPVSRLLVTLISTEPDAKQYDLRLDRTDSDGRFNITNVPAGRYVIAVNKSRFPDPTDSAFAYPGVFYPGVVDQVNAEVITVAPGQKLTGLDFRVPLRRPPSVAVVQVVWADGSPVKRATLLLRDLAGEADSNFSAQADEHGRFTINGYVGQNVIVEARSNRPYVPLGDRYEPMERSQKVQVTLEKPQETIKVVITKIR